MKKLFATGLGLLVGGMLAAQDLDTDRMVRPDPQVYAKIIDGKVTIVDSYKFHQYVEENPGAFSNTKYNVYDIMKLHADELPFEVDSLPTSIRYTEDDELNHFQQLEMDEAKELFFDNVEYKALDPNKTRIYTKIGEDRYRVLEVDDLIATMSPEDQHWYKNQVSQGHFEAFHEFFDKDTLRDGILKEYFKSDRPYTKDSSKKGFVDGDHGGSARFFHLINRYEKLYDN